MYNLTPTELTHVDTILGQINPELPQLLTNMGIYTDPDYVAYSTAGAATYIDPGRRAYTEPVTRIGRRPQYGVRRIRLLEHRQRPGQAVRNPWTSAL